MDVVTGASVDVVAACVEVVTGASVEVVAA